MTLSSLQRFILRVTLEAPTGRVGRNGFADWYKRRQEPVQVENITRALERLIDRGLMIGYGRRTPKKWFIETVRLTPIGKRITKETFGKHQKLPLK